MEQTPVMKDVGALSSILGRLQSIYCYYVKDVGAPSSIRGSVRERVRAVLELREEGEPEDHERQARLELRHPVRDDDLGLDGLENDGLLACTREGVMCGNHAAIIQQS